MKRIVGKFEIDCYDGKIDKDNYYKYSVTINVNGVKIFMSSFILNLFMAETLRYSEKEKEIEDVLLLHVENLKYEINNIQKILGICGSL